MFNKLFNIFFSSNATPSVPKVATASDYETVKDAFLLMQAENARIERQNRALLWMYNFILSKVDCKHPFYQDDKSISKTDYLKEYKMLFKNGDDTCLVE